MLTRKSLTKKLALLIFATHCSAHSHGFDVLRQEQASMLDDNTENSPITINPELLPPENISTDEVPDITTRCFPEVYFFWTQLKDTLGQKIAALKSFFEQNIKNSEEFTQLVADFLECGKKALDLFLQTSVFDLQDSAKWTDMSEWQTFQEILKAHDEQLATQFFAAQEEIYSTIELWFVGSNDIETFLQRMHDLYEQIYTFVDSHRDNPYCKIALLFDAHKNALHHIVAAQDYIATLDAEARDEYNSNLCKLDKIRGDLCAILTTLSKLCIQHLRLPVQSPEIIKQRLDNFYQYFFDFSEILKNLKQQWRAPKTFSIQENDATITNA